VDLTVPKNSGYWQLSQIRIDDDGNSPGYISWLTAYYNRTWCTGSGTEIDPYLIENVMINASTFESGIIIRDSSVHFILRNITVFNSGLNANDAGIKLINVRNGKLLNNNCSFNPSRGIHLFDCTNIIITGNTAKNNNYGIDLRNCNYSRISNNIFSDNNFMGFYLGEGNYNNITGNLINNNHQDGITLWKPPGGLCHNNLIFKNTISGNTFSSASDYYGGNYWNNTYIGNYYSNYFGNDNNPKDGIGDTIHNISDQAVDYHPLMYPIEVDTDGDGLINGEEYIIGEDGVRTNVTNPDSDYEGLTDYWEWLNGTDPWNPDTDSDNFNDFNEIVLGTNPKNTWWYPMPNLNITEFSVSNVIEGQPFTLKLTIQNNGIWKAEGVIVIIRCEALNLTLYNNSVTPFNLEVDESKTILSDNSGFNVVGFYVLTLTIDPNNLINETFSQKDGSSRSNWETDNIKQMQIQILSKDNGNIQLILIILTIIVSSIALSTIIIIRKRSVKARGIRVFICHAVDDYRRYRIGEIAKYLDSQKEISHVYYCEEDLVGDIDDWMYKTVPKCQLLIFFSTDNSLNSEDCVKELRLALRHNIQITPILGPNMKWDDLELKWEDLSVDISRQLGKDYDPMEFDKFCEDLHEYIIKYKRELEREILEKKKSKKNI